MNKKRFLSMFAVLFLLVFSSSSIAEINLKTPAWQKVKDLGSKDSYTFLFLGNEKTAGGKKMLTTIKGAKQELADKKAEIIKVKLDDPKERDLVSFFRIKDDPTVLVVAPNGAITGYYSKAASIEALRDSLIPSKEAEIVKNVQEGRVVFLLFHKDVELNVDAIKTDITAVADNFKGAVNVIYANSEGKEDKSLTNKFQVSSAQPTVFIIAPPGRAVAKLEGLDITKEKLMKALVATCGGGGCGPAGCK